MRADSTRARMLAFFEANPDEELTVAQAAVKFSVTEAVATAARCWSPCRPRACIAASRRRRTSACATTGTPGQIGLEETPEQFIAKLVEVFREVRRVLRDDGTLWLNLGDSYAGSRWWATPPRAAGRFAGADRTAPVQRTLAARSWPA
jgi:hypothetical protein